MDFHKSCQIVINTLATLLVILVEIFPIEKRIVVLTDTVLYLTKSFVKGLSCVINAQPSS